MSNPIGPVAALTKALNAYVISQSAVKAAAADVHASQPTTDSKAGAAQSARTVADVHPQQ